MYYTLLLSIPASLVYSSSLEGKEEGKGEETRHSPLNRFQDHYGSWPAVWKNHMYQLLHTVYQHLEFTSLTTHSHYPPAAGPREEWNGLLKRALVKQHSEIMLFYLTHAAYTLNQLSLPTSEDTRPGIKGLNSEGPHSIALITHSIPAGMEILALNGRMLSLMGATVYNESEGQTATWPFGGSLRHWTKRQKRRRLYQMG